MIRSPLIRSLPVRDIQVDGINWVVPLPSNSGKWRFSSGIPDPKHEIILVVTSNLGRGDNPTQMLHVENIYLHFPLFMWPFWTVHVGKIFPTFSASGQGISPPPTGSTRVVATNPAKPPRSCASSMPWEIQFLGSRVFPGIPSVGITWPSRLTGLSTFWDHIFLGGSSVLGIRCGNLYGLVLPAVAVELQRPRTHRNAPWVLCLVR